MKHNIQFYFFLILSLFLFSACHKDDHHHDSDGSIINFVIYSPTIDQEFHSGDTIPISISVSSNKTIHIVELRIFDHSTDSLIFIKTYHPHTSLLEIKETFVHITQEHQDLRLSIQTLDHDENQTGLRELLFHCHNL